MVELNHILILTLGGIGGYMIREVVEASIETTKEYLLYGNPLVFKHITMPILERKNQIADSRYKLLIKYLVEFGYLKKSDLVKIAKNAVGVYMILANYEGFKAGKELGVYKHLSEDVHRRVNQELAKKGYWLKDIRKPLIYNYLVTQYGAEQISSKLWMGLIFTSSQNITDLKENIQRGYTEYVEIVKQALQETYRSLIKEPTSKLKKLENLINALPQWAPVNIESAIFRVDDVEELFSTTPDVTSLVNSLKIRLHEIKEVDNFRERVYLRESILPKIGVELYARWAKIDSTKIELLKARENEIQNELNIQYWALLDVLYPPKDEDAVRKVQDALNKNNPSTFTEKEARDLIEAVRDIKALLEVRV